MKYGKESLWLCAAVDSSGSFDGSHQLRQDQRAALRQPLLAIGYIVIC